MATQNFVFDGETDIDSDPFHWSSEWDDGFMLMASFWNGNEPGPHRANITLTGSGWEIDRLRFAGDGGIFANITDANSGAGRRIDSVNLGRGGGTVEFDITRVRTLTSDGAVDLTIGREGIESAILGDGDDRVDIGSGGADYLDLRGGDNTVTVRDEGRIRFLHSDGDTDITLLGESRVYMVKVDDGTHSMTTDAGFVESYFSYMGTNTLNIGIGGIGAIQFHGEDQHQTVRATGFVNTLVAADRITVDLRLGAEGGSTIHLADGDDTVQTGSGFVGYVATGNGDDTLDIGSGAIGAVRLRGGDDRVIVRATDIAETGSYINAGGEIDTLDLSRVGAAVSIDLGEADWQEVAVGRGFLRVHNFENLIGGTRGDTLTGNDFANVLTGGRGNDRLTGAEGIDTFVFSRNTGRDTITDFVAGEDLLDIVGANRLSQLRFVDTGDDVQIQFGRARITILDATVAEVRDVDNFLF